MKKTLKSVVLAQRGFTGGSGPTGSFKQNRLRRMFENEINWLDKYFGERSLSTEEYKKHDYRNGRKCLNRTFESSARTKLYFFSSRGKNYRSIFLTYFDQTQE